MKCRVRAWRCVIKWSITGICKTGTCLQTAERETISRPTPYLSWSIALNASSRPKYACVRPGTCLEKSRRKIVCVYIDVCHISAHTERDKAEKRKFTHPATHTHTSLMHSLCIDWGTISRKNVKSLRRPEMCQDGARRKTQASHMQEQDKRLTHFVDKCPVRMMIFSGDLRSIAYLSIRATFTMSSEPRCVFMKTSTFFIFAGFK